MNTGSLLAYELLALGNYDTSQIAEKIKYLRLAWLSF